MRKFPFEDPIETQVRTATATALAGEAAEIALVFDATAAGIGAVAEDLLKALPPPRAIACRAGCAHCCTSREVHVSPLGAVRLFHVLAELPEDARRRVRSRAAEQTARKDADHLAGNPLTPLPCPLLEDGRCVAYDFRPFVCRGFNSFDADICARNKSGDKEADIKGYAVQNAVWQAALRGLQLGCGERGLSGDLLDLARALHVLFENDTAVTDWLRGGGALDAAKSRMTNA